MMSRSWVARSIATPASWMRSGSGPTRVAWARKTRPMRPVARSARASLPTAGLKRSTWPTISLRPAARAAPRMRRASARRGRDRLLDQHVLAGGERVERDLGVHARTGAAMRDRVDRRGARSGRASRRTRVDRAAADALARAVSSSGRRRRRPARASTLLATSRTWKAPIRPHADRRRSRSSLRHGFLQLRLQASATVKLGDPLGGACRRRRSAGARRGAACAAPAREGARGRRRRACSSPSATVSTHSVSSRSVTQGTPHR